MSKIILKKVSIVSFKGIRNLTIDLDRETNIFGANGTGKTSIFDAFTWLLFGKNSEDKKDFQVKRLDKNGDPIQKKEVEVSAIVWVDNEQITIKKILKEKWVKQRGSLDAEFTGNETLYYWNEVPLSMKEFLSKVNSILDEQIFKLITSPTAFNTLKWQDRRNVLVQIVGEISDKELAKGNIDYENLINQLSNKTLDEYKKQVASTIKKAKDDIKTIPTRIDEVERGKPEHIDVAKIESEISYREREIENLERQLQDKSIAYEEVIKLKTENQQQIFELKSQINSIEFQVKEKAKLETMEDTSKIDTLHKQINETKGELESAKAGLNSLQNKCDALKTQVKLLEKEVVSKREEWAKVNSEEFKPSDSDCKCPTCNRMFDDVEDRMKEIEENFSNLKNQKLKNIQEKGKALTSEKNNLENEIKTLEARINQGNLYCQDLSSKILKLQGDLLIENNAPKTSSLSYNDLVTKLILENETYHKIKNEIKVLEAKTFNLPNDDNVKLNESKKTIQKEINDLKAMLYVNNRIKQDEIRIAQLKDDERKLAQEIANIEKIQYIIDNFVKLKIDTLEGRINEKFQFVKFKLFQTQINGTEIECCDALIDGVPFSDANTASKINAGVDIINTLCYFYNVSAPIFIDNRESVVNLIDSNSQIINLVVSASDTKLRVESKS